MKENTQPIIYEIKYDKESLEEMKNAYLTEDNKNAEYIFEYPTVYIVNNKNKKEKYDVYVGETNDILIRTQQHLTTDVDLREDWNSLSKAKNSRMYVIGNEYFNKSLTLDIENKLMHYLSSSSSVASIHNRRTNQQNKYYTDQIFDKLFSKIWNKLHRLNKELFPHESIIRDSALFKASPFHKLTSEQLDAKEIIKQKVIQAVEKDDTGQLIFVAGEAGSGKTVLMSSLFYELSNLAEEYPEVDEFDELSVYLVVNHDQQLKVYDDIATKLGIKTKVNPEVVNKPTRFIRIISPDEPVDVVIVDEAHLLWTQGKQAYQGKNQLYDLLERAKVVVAVFDINQVLAKESYWEGDKLERLVDQTKENDNYIYLTNQMRINADERTVKWIRSLVDEQQVYQIPKEDSKNYEIKIFENIEDLDAAIQEKAKDESHGISRLVATFDWKYVDGETDEDGHLWYVEEGDWKKPWNLQLKEENQDQSIKNKNLSWAEQPHTIHEVGSTYTVQGFDLNYAGLIIGPSVKYRNGEIVFDREASQNKKAIQRRKMEDGHYEYLSDELLKNELNVLLTRGINGLYIYAVDPQLREALLKAQEGDL